MVDSGCEFTLGWLEGVISWYVNVQEEHSTSEGAVIRSHDGGLQVVLVLLVNWSDCEVCGWIFTKVEKFSLDSLKGHLRKIIIIYIIIY